MDLLGKALTDYWQGDTKARLVSHSSFGQAEPVPASYFFRGYQDMPELEQRALAEARGRVLDIGSGAGSHCLWLQQRGIECIGLDVSPGATEVARARGVKQAICERIEDFRVGKFDTLLLLMNGAGLAGTLAALPVFLSHLKGLMAPGGQLLLDSSDVIYMYEEDTDGGYWIPGDLAYYGEVRYQWEYRGQKGPEFPWLFVDFEHLKQAAEAVGLQAEQLEAGPHYDYLARVTAPAY